MQNTKHFKLISYLLAMVMVITLFPNVCFAENEGSAQSDAITYVSVVELMYSEPVDTVELPSKTQCNATGVKKDVSVEWYEFDSSKKTEKKVTGAAEHAKYYIAKYTLVPEEGYGLSIYTRIYLSSASNAATSYELKQNDNGTLEVQVTFNHARIKPDDSRSFIPYSDLENASFSNLKNRKVYFGQNNKTWYIEGYDGTGMVLMNDCTNPLVDKAMQFSTGDYTITGVGNIQGTYTAGTPSTVYGSHYGSSDIRKELDKIGKDTNYFSESEQKLMRYTTIFSYDAYNNKAYATTDRLYLAHCDIESYNDGYILTVGKNRVDSLNSGIEVCAYCTQHGNTNTAAKNFWLRTEVPKRCNPYMWSGDWNHIYSSTDRKGYLYVVPVFAMDPSTINFLSTAPVAKDKAELSDILTIRYSPNGMISSNVTFDGSKIVVNKSVDDEDLYVYVQGKDWVYSKAVTSSEKIITLTDLRYDYCDVSDVSSINVWIERTVDNLTYAKRATGMDEVKKEIGSFVTRVYTQLLGREAEAAGVTYWTNSIFSGTTSCAQVVELFARSEEIAMSGISNEELVNRIYLTMLDRSADEGGLSYWKSLLDKGSTVSLVVAGFAGSKEFRELCAKYNMQPGSIVVSNPRDINTHVTAFVGRCYTMALGRAYDVDGLESWCNLINTKQLTPVDTARAFIFSDEFVKKNLSNEDYIKVLYRTFMGREADQGGLDYWVGELSSGRKSREAALDGFAYAPEFQKILELFGL